MLVGRVGAGAVALLSLNCGGRKGEGERERERKKERERERSKDSEDIQRLVPTGSSLGGSSGGESVDFEGEAPSLCLSLLPTSPAPLLLPSLPSVSFL